MSSTDTDARGPGIKAISEAVAPLPAITRDRPLRLVTPTLLMVAFWVITEASYQLEMGMFYRFVTRTLTILVMLIYFLVWGLRQRHFTFGQRMFLLLWIIGSMSLAGLFSHVSMGLPAMAMVGLPLALSASLVWLWMSRPFGPKAEILGISLICVGTFAGLSLLRWDGMSGRQRSLLNWRWVASGEERFRREQSQQDRASLADVTSRPPLQQISGDWTSFRGGEQQSTVTGVEFGDWSKSPPAELWRRRVGPAWSSVIAIGGYLFTQEQRDDREAVVCYAAETGEQVWVHRSEGAGDRFEEHLSGSGPRATPAFHENRIYAYGAKGQFECLDATNGHTLWSHSLFTRKDGPAGLTSATVPQWGAATSPVIVDDLVVVFAGGNDGKSVLAFDHQTGELRWHAAGGQISYSSPQVMTIDGVRQLVMQDEGGLSGIRIADGALLWRHKSPFAVSFQPMLQPHLVAPDRLIVNWDSGLLCLQLHSGEPWQLEEIWTSNRLKPSFNDFAIHDGYLYGFDDGIFCCVEALTGRRTWKAGRYGFGQLLLLPQLNELLVLTESGDVVRVATDPRKHRELGQFKAIEGKTWNHPLLAHGLLVVRNSEEMACFDLREIQLAQQAPMTETK